MLHAIDDALESMVKDALAGTKVAVSFEAPTREWAAGLKGAAVGLFLYDVMEDARRREVGTIDVRNDDGRITGRRVAPRVFQLSYLVTAWSSGAVDEHRLLASVLACFLRIDRVPIELLGDAFVETDPPTTITVARPWNSDRTMAELWQAIGGPLRPSLNLVVNAPFDLGRLDGVAPLVTEEPRFRFGDEEAQRRIQAEADRSKPAPPPRADETVLGGDDATSGRRFDLKELPRPDPPA